MDPLSALLLRSEDRLGRSWRLPVVWGLAALVLVLSAVILLMKVHAFPVLTILLALGGVTILGLGTVSGAMAIGGRIQEAAGDFDRPPLDRLKTGLILLTAASVFPFIGWFTLILAALAGTGAVSESLTTRE